MDMRPRKEQVHLEATPYYHCICVRRIFRNGWITEGKLREIAEPLRKSGYGEYLLGLIDGQVF